MPTRCPTLVRGVLYPSISEAARALGISHSCLIRYLDLGRPDDAGLIPPTRPRPVIYDGDLFPSIHALAVHLQIPRAHIYNMIRYNTQRGRNKALLRKKPLQW